MYREENLRGGHVIKLGPGNDEAAKEALESWPGQYFPSIIILYKILTVYGTSRLSTFRRRNNERKRSRMD